MRVKPVLNVDIRIGFKEIVAIAVSIPLVYEKIRRLKLRYDKKERNIRDSSGTLRPGDVLFDAEGVQYEVIE